MYDETMVQPMREELTSNGVKELRTADDVDNTLRDLKGTALVIVNSVCGCSAGSARPGVLQALKHPVIPDQVVTVFAGQDREATAQARRYFSGYQPSSPQVALLRNGDVVFMLERHQIEGHFPEQISGLLIQAFDHFCGEKTEEIPATDPVVENAGSGEATREKGWQFWK